MVINQSEAPTFDEISWFPTLRSRREHTGHDFPRIEVWADSMRVGKTTAVDLLTEGFVNRGIPVTTWHEEWQYNPFLQASYANPLDVWLQSQMWFLLNKHRQRSAANSHAIDIQDLPPEGDYAYAKANRLMDRMMPDDYALYTWLYNSLSWENIDAPDLLVYLKASENVMIRRAKKSMRNFEKVDAPYFVKLKEVNRDILEYVRPTWNILEVDTDMINISPMGNNRDEFFMLVLNRLRNDGWSL